MQEKGTTSEGESKSGFARRTMMKALGGTALAGAGLSGTASASSHADPFVFRGWKVSSDVYDYFGVVAWVVERDDGDIERTYFRNHGAGGNGRVWLGPNAVAAYAIDGNGTLYPNWRFVNQASWKLLDNPGIEQSNNGSIVFLNNVDRSDIGSLSLAYAAGNYGRDADCVTLSRADLLGETERSGVVYQDGANRTLLNVRKLAGGGPAVATHATFMYGPCNFLCGRWTNDQIEFPIGG